MMMVFGMFVFTLRTAPYQQLQHAQEWRHVKNDRVNQSAGWQYIGPGEDIITLSGCSIRKLPAATCRFLRLRRSDFLADPGR